MKGKLIVIEGTDCSGKETQSKLLEEKLNQENIKSKRLSFPRYDTPTGKIVGACYLGKEYLCQELFREGITGWFPEGASQVDPIVASQFFALDRRYNASEINKLLNDGVNVILDRYVASNMAHQGGKIKDEASRGKMFKKLELLEYEINEIPKPDYTLLLYVPYQVALELKKNRQEKADQHESDKNHLINAEKTYLELAEIYNFNVINCSVDNQMRSIEDINNEVYENVKKLIKK